MTKSYNILTWPVGPKVGKGMLSALKSSDHISLFHKFSNRALGLILGADDKGTIKKNSLLLEVTVRSH